MTNRGPLFFRATAVDRRSGPPRRDWQTRHSLVHQILNQLTVFIAGDPNQFSPLVPFPEDSVFLTVEPLALALQDSFGYQNLSIPSFLPLKSRLGSR